MSKVDYRLLGKQLISLSEQVNYDITVLANASALLFEVLPDLNWAGFYLVRDGELLLGPFQGKSACTKIAIGRGVCGTAAKTGNVQRVEDVHAFPGHIACDCASNSEIVIPIYNGEELYGVLDIDSPLLSRFSVADEDGLVHFVHILEDILFNEKIDI